MDTLYKPTKEQRDKCITHHYACDCREYAYQNLIAELETINSRMSEAIASNIALQKAASVVFELFHTIDQLENEGDWDCWMTEMRDAVIEMGELLPND